MADENEGKQERRRSSSRRSRRRSSRRSGRWRRRSRRCLFCTEGISRVDYRDVDRLRRFVTERGKIRHRRQTGACARHQRQLTKAIKRARFLALLPYTAEHIHW